MPTNLLVHTFDAFLLEEPTPYLDGLQGYYLATSRELTRLESITKAPVIHHFSETVQGVMTIRCFRKGDSFFQENLKRVNSSLRMDFHNNGANEWLGFRLELIGSFVLCVTALLMVTLPKSIVKPGTLSFFFFSQRELQSFS